MRSSDVPICDICEQREATSIDDGIYRCERCETAHERLDQREIAKLLKTNTSLWEAL